MKILFISLGLGLAFAFIFPSMLDTIFQDQAVKTVLFYVGAIILLGGLGGLADWVEDKEKNNQDEIKT